MLEGRSSAFLWGQLRGQLASTFKSPDLKVTVGYWPSLSVHLEGNLCLGICPRLHVCTVLGEKFTQEFTTSAHKDPNVYSKQNKSRQNCNTWLSSADFSSGCQG